MPDSRLLCGQSFALLCFIVAALLCSALLLLLKMTNIWPHMLQALPPTVGHHNHGDADAYDHGDGDVDDDEADDDADDIMIANISMIKVPSI